MEKKNNILLITNGFPYDGSEVSFLDTEFQLLTQRYHISVLALGANPNGNIDSKYRKEDVRYYSVSVPKLNPIGLIAQLFHKWVRKEICNSWSAKEKRNSLRRIPYLLLFSYRSDIYYKKIEEIFNCRQFDLIYTFWCTPATFSAYRYAKDRGIKYMTRFHGGDLYVERMKERGSYFPFRTIIADTADRLVFLSDAAKEYFSSHWKIQDGRGLISPLGTHPFATLPYFEISENVVSMVTTANSIKLKRINLIIDAIAEVDSKYHIIWNYFGNGEDWSELKSYADMRLSKGNIEWHFRGKIRHEELYDWYKKVQASVFILASETEGVPVSIEEALGMGLAIIATDVGGVKEEVIQDVTGYLLRSDPTVEEIKNAIEKYIDLSVEKKIAMKKESVELWERKYDARLNAKKLIASIEDILGAG